MMENRWYPENVAALSKSLPTCKVEQAINMLSKSPVVSCRQAVTWDIADTDHLWTMKYQTRAASSGHGLDSVVINTLATIPTMCVHLTGTFCTIRLQHHLNALMLL